MSSVKKSSSKKYNIVTQPRGRSAALHYEARDSLSATQDRTGIIQEEAIVPHTHLLARYRDDKSIDLINITGDESFVAATFTGEQSFEDAQFAFEAFGKLQWYAEAVNQGRFK